ncbi:MAG TPA: hypothetical protein VGA55_01850 [Bacteroidota bacterium]
MNTRVFYSAPLAIALLVLLPSGLAGQDLLGVFVPGGEAYQLIGGNPFADPEGYHHRGTRSALVRFDYRVDDYYHEVRTDGSSPGLGGIMRSVSLQVPLQSSLLSIEAVSAMTGSVARNTSAQHLHFSSGGKSIRIAYESLLRPALRWRAFVGHSNASSDPLQEGGLAVGIGTPRMGLEVGIEQTTGSQLLGLEVNGVQGSLPLHHRNLTTSVRAAGTFSGMNVGIAAYTSVPSRLPGSAHEGRLEFLPNGLTRGMNLHAEAGLTNEWKVLARIEESSFRGGGSFASEGSDYARVRDVFYSTLSAAAGMMGINESSLIVADLRWQRIRGSLRGHAESWPFVSTLQFLLTQRANFDVGGRFDVYQIHAGGSTFVVEGLQAGVGINLVTIQPSLRVESWQPGVFGVGKHGYQDRRLTVTGMDGVIVSAGARWNIGSLRLSYALTQFVPVSVRTSTLPDGTAELVAPPSGGSVIKSGGGQFHRLSFEFEGW